MPDYFGYKQHPYADEQHPWWVAILVFHPAAETLWVRTDGLAIAAHGSRRTETNDVIKQIVKRLADESLADAMDRLDRKYPLPAPPPKCLQVWVWPDTGVEATVLRVYCGTALFACSTPEQEPKYRVAPQGWGVRRQDDWPPPGAVLAKGEGAPWRRTGEADA